MFKRYENKILTWDELSQMYGEKIKVVVKREYHDDWYTDVCVIDGVGSGYLSGGWIHVTNDRNEKDCFLSSEMMKDWYAYEYKEVAK